MVDTPFRAKFADQWTKLQKAIAAGQAPDAATLIDTKNRPADPEAIKAVLAPYLLLRAGQRIDTRSLSTSEELPDGYFGEFKRVATDRKALYRLTGEYLLYSEALSQRQSEKPKRQALASALAATRATLELLDDTWLAARASEALLLPQLPNASKADGPLSRRAVLTAVVAAHSDDPEGLTVAFKQLIESAGKREAADGVRFELAGALHASGRDRDAGVYLGQIEESRRTAEMRALARELEKK
jgi:hypothetical protein